MIKKCKVIARNAINMVVMYDGVEVQMPTDNSCEKEIFVKKIGNGFILSSEDELEKTNKKKQKKTSEAELADANDIATDKIIEE